jgi:hypothetical protein
VVCLRKSRRVREVVFISGALCGSETRTAA